MIRLSLFAAQEIPAALITFVSLLVFIQMGTSPALSTLYSALLSLPWILKLWGVGVVHRVGHFKQSLLCAEFLCVLLLGLMGEVLSPSSYLFSAFTQSTRSEAVFALLFLLSLGMAWHEMVADIYYVRALGERLRPFYDAPRQFVARVMVMITYGLLIIVVGTLEVVSRSILQSWAMAFRITAGVLALFLLWHTICFFRQQSSSTPAFSHRQRHKQREGTWHLSRSEWLPYLRGYAGVGIPFIVLLLLPQSLMFYSRVLFLLSSSAEGGLSRSLQEVGFVHGVVGAVAYSLGLTYCRYRMLGRSDVRLLVLEGKMPVNRGRIDRWRFLVSPLLLSPLLYVWMTYEPPRSFWLLSAYTFVSQFWFGYGLYQILHLLGMPTLSALRKPVIALSMLVPLALSGVMLEHMSYRTFFWVDALTAVLPLLYAVFFPRRGSVKKR